VAGFNSNDTETKHSHTTDYTEKRSINNRTIGSFRCIRTLKLRTTILYEAWEYV